MISVDVYVQHKHAQAVTCQKYSTQCQIQKAIKRQNLDRKTGNVPVNLHASLWLHLWILSRNALVLGPLSNVL